jgi:hypothetical protein
MNEMKQTFKFFVAIAVIAAGMTACSSEEILPTVQPTIERANLTITINNNEAATKAVDDPNAVVAETGINSISLFIFGPAMQAEADTVFTLSGSNPFAETVTDNEYKATFYGAPIGSKSVYVGVNLPTGLHNDIKTRGVSAVYELSTVTNLATLYPATGGFPMFSDETLSPVKEIQPKATTTVNVSVKRFVAKVTLETSADFETEAKRKANGMTVDKDLKFAMGQMNTKFFPYPKKLGSIYEDPNYRAVVNGTSFDYEADFIKGWSYDFENNTPWTSAFDDFKSVTSKANAGDITKFTPAYVLENTNEYKLKGELTYVLVRAKFTPDNTHSYANSQITATPNTSNTLPELYVINDGGTYYYFKSKTEAESYATDRKLEYKKYTDCVCFYTVYLNPDKYNVLRNDYYKVKVDEVVRLGNPLPGVEDPTFEIGGTAALLVTVNVQEWNMVPQDTKLGEE